MGEECGSSMKLINNGYRANTNSETTGSSVFSYLVRHRPGHYIQTIVQYLLGVS